MVDGIKWKASIALWLTIILGGVTRILAVGNNHFMYVAHFPRRSEMDLKAVTRAIMRKVLPIIDRSNEEDNKLAQDIEMILSSDDDDDAEDDSVPYVGATKRQIAEYRTFLINAPTEYVEHIEKKGMR